MHLRGDLQSRPGSNWNPPASAGPGSHLLKRWRMAQAMRVERPYWHSAPRKQIEDISGRPALSLETIKEAPVYIAPLLPKGDQVDIIIYNVVPPSGAYIMDVFHHRFSQTKLPGLPRVLYWDGMQLLEYANEPEARLVRVNTRRVRHVLIKWEGIGRVSPRNPVPQQYDGARPPIVSVADYHLDPWHAKNAQISMSVSVPHHQVELMDGRIARVPLKLDSLLQMDLIDLAAIQPYKAVPLAEFNANPVSKLPLDLPTRPNHWIDLWDRWGWRFLSILSIMLMMNVSRYFSIDRTELGTQAVCMRWGQLPATDLVCSAGPSYPATSAYLAAAARSCMRDHQLFVYSPACSAVFEGKHALTVYEPFGLLRRCQRRAVAAAIAAASAAHKGTSSLLSGLIGLLRWLG